MTVPSEAPADEKRRLFIAEGTDALALQEPMQAEASEVRDLRLQGERHIIDQQQGLIAEAYDRCSSDGARRLEAAMQ